MLQIRQDSAVLGRFESRTHFSDASFVESISIAISETGFGARNVVLRDSVLGEELKTDIAHAVVTSRTGRKKIGKMSSVQSQSIRI